MFAATHRLLLRIFARLPRWARRRVVRTLYPSFTVGAMCIIERGDGQILLVRHSYRKRWGVPGGLLQRREEPAIGARREVFEEVGLQTELLGDPAVFVDSAVGRVDIIYRARPVDGATVAVPPGSPEIVEARWFRPEAFPELQDETANAIEILARASRDGDGHDDMERRRGKAS